MKQVFYLAVMLISLSVSAATPPDVNQKVLKAFNTTFINAEDVTWKEMENSVQANFKLSQIQVRASYDHDGNLLETVRYYGEQNLPPNILDKLKKRYTGKTVFGITEISSDNEVSYHISLKDEKFWYTVKSDPYGSLQQTDKFKRAETDM